MKWSFLVVVMFAFLCDPQLRSQSASPKLTPPSIVFRPDNDSWPLLCDYTVCGGTAGVPSTYLSREFINILVYGPPDSYSPGAFDQSMFGQAVGLAQLASPIHRDTSPGDNSTSTLTTNKWVRLTGETDLTPIFGFVSPICLLNNVYTPVRSDNSFPVQPISDLWSTTQCPAITGPDYYLGFNPQPEYVDGIRERNHFRVWDFNDTRTGGQYHSTFVSSSNEENFAIPGRCENGNAHCVTDQNESRDETVCDAIAGARAKGWTVVGPTCSFESVIANGPYDLTGQPIYQNAEPGPYYSQESAANANPTLINSHLTGFARVPQWTTDGIVRVVCLDKNNTGYCNSVPAQRPMVFNNNVAYVNGSPNPAGSGALLIEGQSVAFSTDIGYSDGLRNIDPASVTFTLRYDVEQTNPKTLGTQVAVADGSQGTGVTRWHSTFALPTDANLNATTGTESLRIDVHACDDAHQCWTYQGVPYVLSATGYPLSDTGVLVPGGDSYLWGINDAGEAVGQATGSDNLQHLVIYSQGSLRDFGTLNGQDTIGLSINNNSQIGGYSHGPEATSSLGFIYDRSHGLFNSVTLAGNQTSVVNQYALNNSGAYAGDYVDRSDNAKTLRVYTGNGAGTPTPLALPTGKSWGAFSINDSGVIAGFGGANVNSLQPYLLTTPAPSALFLPGGDTQGFATGINGNNVVGATWSDPERSHAVKWDRTTPSTVAPLTLQSPPLFSRALAVNSSGDAVGYARDTVGGQQYAAYWSNGYLYNLTNFIPASAGWKLLSATGISSNGAISGYGRLNGHIHGFVMTIAH